MSFLYVTVCVAHPEIILLTSPGGQIDASVVDSYMKSMFFSDFLQVFGGLGCEMG